VITPPFYPTRPPKDATRLDRMRFLRKNYVYATAWLLPLLIVGLVFSSTFVLLVCAVAVVIQAAGAALLELQMRSERRGGSS
jgi:hypothetical protein